MIAWSIQAALKSRCFDRVIVSTDDDEIAEVAVDCGAETPFRRPAALSDDHSGTIPVIAHAIDWLGEEEGVRPEAVCCLYATAPFVRAMDLRRGFMELKREDADYVFSVTSYAFPVQRALKIDKDGYVAMFQPEHFHSRSQDLEEAYHDAGQFYFLKGLGRCFCRDIMCKISIPQKIGIVLSGYSAQCWRRRHDSNSTDSASNCFSR